MAGKKEISPAKQPENIQPTPVRRSPRRLFKGTLLLLGCALAVAFVVYSPLFTVQRITVAGNSYLSADEVASIAGLHRGEPLFKIETAAMADRLTHDLRIETASVRREFPDTIAVTITERQVVATVATAYGYADFDRQGKVMSCYRNLHQVPIPLITGITLPDLYVGDDNPDPTVAKVLELLQDIDSNSLNMLSEVNIADPQAVKCYTNNAVEIRLGRLDRIEEKAKLVQDFLSDLSTTQHKIDYVDFSYKAPVIKLHDMPAGDAYKP